MRSTQSTMDGFQSVGQNELVPPAVFVQFIIACVIGGVLSIILSLIVVPVDDPMYHFNEGGAITVLSSILLSMASVLALLIFYMKTASWSFGNLFWLALSAATLFLALDEHLQFHEKVGAFVSSTSVGEAQFFRNWNDLIVILYGVAALAGAAVFGREIFKCRAFAICLAIGFAFYVIHTGIDSTIANSWAWKDLPEESAKLFSVMFIFLAVCGQILALLNDYPGLKKPTMPSQNR